MDHFFFYLLKKFSQVAAILINFHLLITIKIVHVLIKTYWYITSFFQEKMF